jgi:RNA polymerase sigma-70 factor (sigma-E family)
MDEPARREFVEFVRARTGALFRVAYALTERQHLAEDLLQSALEKVAVRWQRIEDPERYVKRVMYHEYISWWRRRRRETPVPVTPQRADPTDQSAEADLRDAVRRALAKLTPRQRAVLVLRYLEDCSEAEVARILDCGQSTVSSMASRALARLRTLCPELRDTDLEACRDQR